MQPVHDLHRRCSRVLNHFQMCQHGFNYSDVIKPSLLSIFLTRFSKVAARGSGSHSLLAYTRSAPSLQATGFVNLRL